jgi:hypothetical protein
MRGTLLSNSRRRKLARLICELRVSAEGYNKIINSIFRLKAI